MNRHIYAAKSLLKTAYKILIDNVYDPEYGRRPEGEE